MNIDNLTIGEAKQIAAMFGTLGLGMNKEPDHGPWQLGKIYLIRTVTMIDTGRLVAVTDQELVIADAAWIADTGRFSDAIAKAQFNEVEPFPDGMVIIGRGSIIDAVQITEAPRTRK